MERAMLEDLRFTLGKCAMIVVFIRGVAKEVGLDRVELADLEREIRARLGDVIKELER